MSRQKNKPSFKQSQKGNRFSSVPDHFSVSLSMAGDLFVFKILARKKVNPGQCWLLSLYTISKPCQVLCTSAFIRSAGKSFKYKMFMGHSVHKWEPECYLSSLTVIPFRQISRARPGGLDKALVGQREKKPWTRLLPASAENVSVPPYPPPSSVLCAESKPVVMSGVYNGIDLRKEKEGR